LDNRKRVDVLHIQWPEWEVVRTKWRESLPRLGAYIGGLAFARLLGYRVAWTAHNLDVREEDQALLGKAALTATAALANDVFINYAAERGELSDRFRRKRNVHLAYHGNYIGWYPDQISRGEARARLGLPPDAFVYLMFGRMKPHKGVPELLAAFDASATGDDRLILAGKFNDADLAEHARQAAASDPRIVIHDRVIPDDEVQVYFRAADVFVLPFRNTTTSGSLLLGLSFGLPVIASRVGNVPEIVAGDCGLTYYPDDPDGLTACLRLIKERDRAEMALFARRRAETFTWRETARALSSALTDNGEHDR
jgi:glycosyltransferase involved in cell wall biosynthesis